VHKFDQESYDEWTIERLKSAMSVDPDTGCWISPIGLDRRGYSRIAYKGRLAPAHRIAYRLLVGPIPEGLEIDHLCRNKACVNPAHLEPVTGAENRRRAMALRAVNPSGYLAKTHCLHGHEMTAENTMPRADKPGVLCRTCQRDKSRVQQERISARRRKAA
jgi:hypothetical protein